MPDSLFSSGAAPALLPLPEPLQARWQPLRIGLVELFHYDSEEFWFRDGHLLLRGNNGTGKSKVLSLTLPFLFDASIKSSRIEPDGDATKKMAWNLLLGKHERRVGYAWIEFGRIGEDGQPHYLTLGCGLSAVAARTQVDTWYFITEGQRVGRELWLIDERRAVLGKERLAQALDGSGQLFDTAQAYRRAVDERLFHLGEARYAALMDTLIQLRQPQLSKKPNEENLSNALTEALAPLPDELLADVAEAMNQLEEYGQQLAELNELAKAVGQFNRRYSQYARVNARRQARVLRTAQTGFDKASRELHEARAAFDADQLAEAALHASLDAAEAQQLRDRAALDEMQSDPRMQDANRIDELARNLAARRRELEAAQAALREAVQRQARDADALRGYAERADAACAALARAAAGFDDAGTAAGLAQREDFAAAAACFAQPDALAALDPAEYEQMERALRNLGRQRRADIAVVAERLRQLDAAGQAREAAQTRRDDSADDLADAAVRLAAGEAELLAQADQVVDAWSAHAAGLRELAIDSAAVLPALADWTRSLEGENPARAALMRSQHDSSLRLAQDEAAALARRALLDAQALALRQEREHLANGVDSAPPAPYQRDPGARLAGRPGAPFWRLVEFRAGVPDQAERAGIEAALEAAGLLDAWVSPDGAIDAGAGAPLFDTLLRARTAQADSLAAWLAPAQPCALDPLLVERLLASVFCGAHDNGAETWIAPDGRFRIGPLAGAWSKPAAEYIGAASRAEARRRRIGEIDATLALLEEEQTTLSGTLGLLAERRTRAAAEWDAAPADTALRGAHVQAAALERERRQFADRLLAAEARLAAALEAWRTARAALERDAADLQLPPDGSALADVSAALDAAAQALQDLLLRAQQVRDVLPERRRQQDRLEDGNRDVAGRREQAVRCAEAVDEARTRLDTLRERVGAQVGELTARLAALRQAVQDGEAALKHARTLLSAASETRAVSGQRAASAAATLEERSALRQGAVHGLEQFNATGLLAIALPELELPPAPWSIEPALGVARRAEQLLLEVDAEDDDWSRVQSAYARDFSELQSALTALGHQGQAEPSDHGMIVTIVYQNRPQRPDIIEAAIRAEIAQRQELLTARETEVLENHLQAEVAAAIQRRLQEADRRVATINIELAKRPTSTGVRFRLQWQALEEGSEGAPVGLEAARKRLLSTSYDAWSPEDRQVVGRMLQNRIAAERARDDAGRSGSLLELLARALDYRRWHRFRVQRWQDGQWRPLSGPASSGERALGLTVPLFAAVSSFYTHAGSRHAPRLVLLDEAFAGIDDAARAHCMALVREFDLDFVMTSEREWACYAELPGVSICQLQRHEGIDAVHVSRWSWDGRARRLEEDGARRFQDAAEASAE
ncbi:MULTISPECIES: TIGR02680 family protein [unclassified Massilia]|uniref:TIGR02680 family protein n=1 Tax=unclassified Massilia TaxID=2609279 RepID=UPI0017872149|nr:MULTISPECIES: TIGR02680 family protein [unclassified Massilia]MBD8533420.1 TIGR02680 family protein [Massilia sp. CFBP 13647]MBD8676812.1 TIGR02680 family protein [Massilia sp. CFBP 13721]